MEEHWTALEETEDLYENSVRQSYSHFQRLDVTLARFRQRHSKMTAWVEQQIEVFSSEQYGNSGVMVEQLLENFAAYKEQLTQYELTPPELEKW